MADQIVVKKNFKYRLYPTSAQIVALDGQLADWPNLLMTPGGRLSSESGGGWS
jgi:hypothetical protein